MIAAIGAHRSARLRPHDSVDRAVVVTGTSQPALHIGYARAIGPISIASPATVAVPIVRITGIVVRIGIWVIAVKERIEERKTKRIDKNERPIVEVVKPMEPIIKIMVTVVPKPTCP